MKSIIKILTKDALFVMGVVLIALSFLLFLISDSLSNRTGSNINFSLFLINYVISIVYFVILWVKKLRKTHISEWGTHVEYGFLHLILCLISAYSLNREIPVFEQSTAWVQATLVVQGLIVILIFFKDLSPQWMRVTLFMIMGVGFMFFLYLSLYLFPLYPIGFVGFLFFGISLHAFVPLFIAGTMLLFLFRDDNWVKVNIAGFSAGVVISFVIVSVFLIRWTETSRTINRVSDRTFLDEKTELPSWVTVAQKMPKNSVTEKILKSGIVYSVAPEHRNWDLFDMPSRNFDEVRKHDPLVMTATTLYGRPKLPAGDRVKVLEAMYDSRHHAQERLWSGENLETNHVVSNIRIYPNLRLAYTEKTLTIRNNHDKPWNPSEEAIYTFHLPEGAVVTSLSLWINGKEENAILTSKNKADSAYRTVVGYEVRDPSLVRWQEGNTVSVRVFPCTPDEDRKFKIGITSPLSKTNNKLIYHNIWFDGPLSSRADESIKLLFMDNITHPDLPSGFDKLRNNIGYSEGAYNPDWQLSFDCPALKDNNFSFDGKSYRISDYQRRYGTLDATDIYLDINSSWTEDEFRQVLEMCQSKNVFVYADKLVKVDGKNREELFDELHHLNFSVFPFYKIAKPGQSLVITKGTTASPNLSDLKGSEFSELLYNCLKTGTSIKLFNLGGELSPYIKTQKELRAFTFDSGSNEYLSRLIKENKFVQSQETNGTIVVDEAAIKISETDGDAPSNAPDHLMRLFAYNHVMYRSGIQYLNSDFYDKTVVDEAYKAYVVSPSTSLVVLETKKDYERFGIQDQGSSLKNASMKSSGAVPEPHEWLLILLLAGLMIFLYVRNK